MGIDYSFSFAELEYFLLIMVRVCTFIYIAPFFGMNNTPNRIKVALGFFVSVLIYNTTLPHVPLSYNTMLGYSMLVVREGVTGLLIGLGARLCTLVVTFAGHIVDMNMGLSMMSTMDPTTRQTSTISGTYYQYSTMLIMLVSGMYQFLILALNDTYRLIPIGKAVFNQEKLVNSITLFMSEYIIIGFRICLPVFVVVMILNTVLGVLAKVAPQMNMFAVGIQIKILVGFIILFLTTMMLPGAANFIFTHIRIITTRMVEGMIPG